MNPFKRIASLHRELAEAYEELARAEETTPPPRKLAKGRPAEDPAAQRAIDRVRQGLRKQGFRS